MVVHRNKKPLGLVRAAALFLALAATGAHAQVTGVWYQWSASTAPATLVQPPFLFSGGPRAVSLQTSDGSVMLDMSPGSAATFQPGAYEGALRAPFNGASPGLDFSVNFGGCNTVSGRFAVLEVAYDANSQITRFAANFEQHCGGADTATFGEVRFNSMIPFTKDEPPGSTAPDPFRFLPVGPLQPSTQAVSNSVTVYGINAPAAISVANGEYSVNGGAFTSSAGTVSNRDSVRVRATSLGAAGTTSAILTVGGVAQPFDVMTVDTTPGAILTGFHLVDFNSGASGAGFVTEGFAPGWTASTSTGSSEVVVAFTSASGGYSFAFATPTGIPPATAMLTPGVYENAISKSSFVSPLISAAAGACSSEHGRFVVLDLAVDGAGNVRTLAIDFEDYCDGNGPRFGEIRINSSVPFTEFKTPNSTVPDAFAFVPVALAQPAQQYVSNAISVMGVNAPVPVSITGGEYSINGGGFTSNPGTVVQFDHIVARALSPAAGGAAASAVLNVGERAATFAVTTYDGTQLTTGLSFDDGASHLFLSPPNLVRASHDLASRVTFTIDASDGQNWRLELDSPTNTLLVPGLYPHAVRFATATQAGIEFDGNGSGCNTTLGRFIVREATYEADGTVHAFAADFEQSCDNGLIEPGQIRYHSTVPFSEILDTNWRRDASVPRKIDLNGDGNADFILRSPLNEYTAYLMNGNAAIGTAVLIPGNSGKVILRTGDFNGDGKTDLIVENFDTSVEVWLMDGLTVTATATLMPPGRGWVVTHVGDFNGDGKTDLVWTNVNDGSVGIWLMDGIAQLARATMLKPQSGYSVNGVGDFDGDGKSDILWRRLDGTTSIWLMDGLTIRDRSSVKAANTTWRAATLGDFDGDGHSDIVWQNLQDGSASMWLMNGLAIKERGSVMPAGGWAPALVADFDGDGHSDLLWRRASDWTLGLWLMNGLTIREHRTMATFNDVTLPIMAVDTDGNGIAELVVDQLLLHGTNGFAIWYLAGTTISRVGTVPGTANVLRLPAVFTGQDYKH